MIGQEIYREVFRDTDDFYHHMPQTLVAPSLMKFAKKNAGKTIFDYGCATGNYCAALSSLGYTVKGGDVNQQYVRIARARGVDAHLLKDTAPFTDRSFETVILFEVLEHLTEPQKILLEAKRLASKNVLITVPNCSGHQELRRQGLLYEHFAEHDHRNFFTADSLMEVLSSHFKKVTVSPGDYSNPFALFPGSWIRLAGKAFSKIGILRSPFYFRLYAVCSI